MGLPRVEEAHDDEGDCNDDIPAQIDGHPLLQFVLIHQDLVHYERMNTDGNDEF